MGELIAFPERRHPVPAASSRESSPGAFQPPMAERTAGSPVHAGRAPGEPSKLLSPRTLAHEPLWREVTGAVLREERLRQDRTLAQVAARAGMSIQYLSELERGRKEASSEMLAAACGSLGLGLAEFAQRCAGAISSVTARPAGPVLLAA